MSDDSTVSVKIEADASSLQDAASQAADNSDTISDHLEALKSQAEGGATGLDQAAEAATGFGSALSRVAEIAAGVDLGLVFQKGLAGAENFFSSAIFGTAELGEKLSNLSESTGISTGTLQQLRLAAQLAGGNFDTLQRSVAQLSLKMLELQSGSKNPTLQTAIADLGLTPSQLEDSEHALDNLAAAIQRVGISQRTIGDVSEIIGGRGGSNLIPILGKLDEAKQKEQELNLILSPGQVKAAADAQEQLNLLGAEWDHFKNVVGLPILGAAADALTTLATDFQDLRQAAADASPSVQSLINSIEQAFLPTWLILLIGQFAELSTSAKAADAAVLSVIDNTAALNAVKGATPLSAHHVEPLDITKPPKATSSGAVGPDPQAGLMTSLEARQRAIKEEADSELAIWTEAAKNVESVDMSKFALEAELIKSAAAQHLITAQQETDQLIELDKRELTSKLTTINSEIAALQKAGTAEQGYYDKIASLQAQSLVLQNQYAAKIVELQTQAATKATAAWTTEFASAVTPISDAFEQSFTGVIQGTQTVSQAFAKMADSIALEMVKSGLHDLLMGGAKNTIGADIFGTTGQGGGIAGELAKAFQGSAISTGLTTALGKAWTALTAPIANVFGQAFNAIGGIVRNIFGSALSGAGSSLASAGAGAAAGAVKQAAPQLVTDMSAQMQLAAMNAELILINTTLTTIGIGIGTMELMLTQMGIALDYLALPKITMTTIEAPFGIGGSQGITAKGGAIVPDDLMGGGGTLSILHPREMVLPPNLSDGVQNAINGGSFGGGGGAQVSVSYTVQTLDTSTMESLLKQHGDVIGNLVASKIRNGGFTGQNVHRGAFRR